MAWATKRRGSDGVVHYRGRDRDPFGAKHTVGTWLDPNAGTITFRQYAEDVWLPSRHLEVTTRAGYQSYLRIHFVPFFGRMPLARIMPSTVQEWVSLAVEQGLSPCSISKYHVMLHAVFARAVRDRILAFNPCEATELPKIVTKKSRILTPEEFASVLAAMPNRFKVLVLTAVETGLRWGELVALRPRHIDFLRGTLTGEETIVEVTRKDSPTGERMVAKPYPKDDEPRTLRISQTLLDAIAARIAVTKAGIDFHVRVHDLRHAHASWLLAGGTDQKALAAFESVRPPSG